MNEISRTAGGIGFGWRLIALAAGVAAMMGLSGPAQAQDPIDCDNLSIELADLFTSPICHRTRFRGGGTIGRSESIHGETRDYMINYHFARSGAGHTYLSSIDFKGLMDYYGLSGNLEILGAQREARDGFDYVSVGGQGLDSCILFLKQTRPIRNGFRARYFGLACDKRRQGEYAPEEAMALLDLIKSF